MQSFNQWFGSWLGPNNLTDPWDTLAVPVMIKKMCQDFAVLLYTIVTLCQNKPMIVTYLHFSPFSHCVLRQQSQHLFSGKPQQFKSPSH